MSDKSDTLTTATDRAKVAKDAWADIYRQCKNDLHFLSDEPYCQWDEKEASARLKVNRPVIQIDQLSQFVHQVSNDIRMNTPTINVIPDDMDSDPETAEVIQGRIKAIEYKSNADAAYDMAADFAVKSSLGFIRVDRAYIGDSFLQELCIKRVVNPLSILLDPDSTEPDGSDAKYVFVFDDVTKKEFERRWPDATPISFGDEKPSKDIKDTDKITIAEYFYIDSEDSEIGLLDDGTSETVSKKKKYKRTRKVTKTIVHHCTLAGEDILEETTFPGAYIPIVPVYGEEAWKEGKRHLLSLIRKSKSAAYMYNLWKSLETEMLIKQQQAPVQAAVGQMRGFEDDWKTPDKAMVLYYHQTDVNDRPAPPPQRLQPPQIPTGFVNASQGSEDDIRKSLGMYNASAGKREGDASGVALKQLDKSSDIGNFHFSDNLVRSVTQVGKVILSALPEVEDSPRIVQTIGAEDEQKAVGINGKMVEGQERHYDFSKGKYGVRVVTGPSFTTQRQEAAANYNQIITAMPELMPVIGDLVFKYQDTPGAQAISSRLKKLVDPKLLDEKEREENAPDPQVAALGQQLQQVTQEASQQIQTLQAELQNKNADIQLRAEELKLKDKELNIKAADTQIKAMQAQKPEAVDLHDQSIKEREMELKEAQFELQIFQTELQAKEKQGGDMSAMDSIGGLRKRLEQEDQQTAESQQQMEQQQLIQQQQAMQEEAEKEEKRMQTEALLTTLVGIQQSVNSLVQAVSAPIDIQRDANGNIVEVK